MSKQSLLLVDGDTRSLRVLEVSLRKAGFMVTAASSVQDALDKLELHAPDLIISETTFPDGDGFELRRRVRATPEWSEIPFIFLTAEAAIENKIRGLELGVDDYLTKPIYIKEIVTRINILLQKRQRVRFEERRDGRTRFAGRVHDMPVVDVIQTIEISRKSGVIQFVGERGRQAAIYFRDGRVIDAEAGALQGEDAVYRLLTWSEGEFEVVFRTVRRREVITMSSQGLLMEGMRRLDEWSRLFEQLPPLTHRFEVDTIELAARLGDVPDDNNRILRLFDGKRTLLEVIDASDVGDLECLQAISRLYFEELLLDLDHGKTPRRDTGKSMPLVELDAPSAVDESTSGPTAFDPGGEAAEGVAEWRATPSSGGHRARPEGRDSSASGRMPRAASESGASGGGWGARNGGARLDHDASGELGSDGWEDAGGIGESGGVGVGAAGRSDGAGARSIGGAAGSTGTVGEAGAGSAGEARAGSVGGVAAAEAADVGGAHAWNAGRAAGAGVIDGTGAGNVGGGLGGVGVDGADAGAALEEAVDRDEPIGPLMGGYRPSSLRLIDEAVAAAQAIEPSLFEERIDEQLRAAGEARGTNGVAPRTESPDTSEAAEAEPEGREAPRPADIAVGRPAAVEAAAHLRAAEREESGLRMIGSLGRDRAEASGELAPLGRTRPLRSETARELVTILPRRITRELPVVAAQELAELPTPTPTPPVLAPRPTPPPRLSGQHEAVSVPVTGQSQRISLPGSGVTAESRSRRLLRWARSDQGGPGLGPLLLIILATVLAGTAVLLRLRRHGAPAPRIEDHAPQPSALPVGPASETPDAVGGGGGGDAGAPAALGPIDAGARSARDAGVADARAADARATPARTDGPAKLDAGASARRDGADDKAAEAKALYAKAQDALDAGDVPRAFAQVEASLRVRKTARTYLLRAQAQQRLDRIDDALASLAAAAQLAPGSGTVWELRGRILWAARRRDEARVAFEKFLQLEPGNPRAASVRRLINEPR